MSKDLLPYGVFTTAFDEVVAARELAARPAPAPAVTSARDTRSGLRPEAGAEAADIAADLPAFDGTVQVLLEMGGSNRGSHVDVIAAVDVLATALEKAGIRFEVLGFTTSTWKGGRSRELWKTPPSSGRERPPGRVCDLLHVVFKEPDAGWRAADSGGPSPAAMVDALYRAPYLKENVDGEALRWALSRASGETRLLVFGDGISVDETTLSLNPSAILGDDRLRALGELGEAGVEVAYVEVTNYPHGDPVPGVTRFEPGTPPAEVARATLGLVLGPAAPAPGR